MSWEYANLYEEVIEKNLLSSEAVRMFFVLLFVLLKEIKIKAASGVLQSGVLHRQMEPQEQGQS